jgi:hypothetical protein
MPFQGLSGSKIGRVGTPSHSPSQHRAFAAPAGRTAPTGIGSGHGATAA